MGLRGVRAVTARILTAAALILTGWLAGAAVTRRTHRRAQARRTVTR